jgi:hypothetical protein
LSSDDNVVPFAPKPTPKLDDYENAVASLANSALQLTRQLFIRKSCFDLTDTEHALELLEAAKVQIERRHADGIT